MKPKRPHFVDCRPVRDTDPEDWPRGWFVASNSHRQLFVSDSEADARRLCDDFCTGRVRKTLQPT
jgi:hypothetical protein